MGWICGGVLCFFCSGFGGGGGGGGVVRAQRLPPVRSLQESCVPCRLEGGKMCADVWQIKDEGRPF